MRPLELVLQDFRSYTGPPTVFDFRDRRLIGIVGPIGSGKSTILDAISFALYGKTPTVAANTRSLIHQRSDGSTVAFRFEVEGEIWEVVRSLRRRGQSQHALYRYSADEADAETVETVTLESDVNERIVALLGLEFDAFGRSVLLAQNRFAEFLGARPSDRDRVLKGVFGFERIDAMRQLARERATAADRAAAELSGRAEALDRLAAEVAAARLELEAAEQRRDLLEELRPQYEALERAGTEARRRLEAGSRAQEALTRLAERLPDRPAAERLLSDHEEAQARRGVLTDELEAAQAALVAAERDAAEAAAARGDLDRAAAVLGGADARRASLAEAVRRHEEAGRREAGAAVAVREAAGARIGAAASVAAAEDELTAAVAAAAEADEALHRARHADMAAALRSSLSPGHPCPVCDQPVPVVPPQAAAPEVEEARGRAEAAAARRRTAERIRADALAGATAAAEAERAAGEAAKVAAEEHAARGAEVAGLESELAEAAGELAALLGPGDPAATLAEQRRLLREAAEAVTAARRRVEQVRGRHADAIRAEQASAGQIRDLTLRLVDVGVRLELEPVEAELDPAGVRRLIAEVHAAWEEQRRSLDGEREAAAAEEARCSEARREIHERAELEDGDLAAAVVAATTRCELLRSALARHERELAEGGSVREERDGWVERRDVFTRLAADLTDARFVRFLLDGERARLAELGSDHFQRMTSGRYRFSSDGAFDVVDLTAADAVRKSASLSGGETFLASLALALALAEMVARTGGRMDAFLLDEGFGSLDPEHLDLAMEGVEALVAHDGDRLVVVVSHVPELRERLEDLIVLDRDPTTGDTVVRSGARRE